MRTHYTLIVGTQNWSSWSLRPYLALAATGAPFQTQVIRLRRSESPTTAEQIRAHSPAGKVPVLKIAQDGGTVTVWDSLAICETIADRHPAAGLLPEDADTRALCRAYACEMHAGFADVRDQLTMDFARGQPLPQLRDATKEQIARILAAWDSALQTYQGDFLFGRFSIADCMYAPVVSRFVTYGVETSDAVRAYIDRVMALPAMAQWGHAAQAEVDAGIA